MPRLQNTKRGTVVTAGATLSKTYLEEADSPWVEIDGDADLRDLVPEGQDAPTEDPEDPETPEKTVELEKVGDEPEKPGSNASLKDWVEYAISQGVPPAVLEGMKRDQVRDLYIDQE